jgi:ribonuclease BN (tRNA processing enzyme)
VTDTGPCDNAVRLARDADLLLAECSYRPGETHHGWPHLNPELAATIARDAGARRLVLVHFDASRYETLGQREEARHAAAELFPAVTAGRDGMVIELPYVDSPGRAGELKADR